MVWNTFAAALLTLLTASLASAEPANNSELSGAADPAGILVPAHRPVDHFEEINASKRLLVWEWFHDDALHSGLIDRINQDASASSAPVIVPLRQDGKVAWQDSEGGISIACLITGRSIGFDLPVASEVYLVTDRFAVVGAYNNALVTLYETDESVEYAFPERWASRLDSDQRMAIAQDEVALVDLDAMQAYAIDERWMPYRAVVEIGSPRLQLFSTGRRVCIYDFDAERVLFRARGRTGSLMDGYFRTATPDSSDWIFAILPDEVGAEPMVRRLPLMTDEFSRFVNDFISLDEHGVLVRDLASDELLIYPMREDGPPRLLNDPLADRRVTWLRAVDGDLSVTLARFQANVFEDGETVGLLRPSTGEWLLKPELDTDADIRALAVDIVGSDRRYFVSLGERDGITLLESDPSDIDVAAGIRLWIDRFRLSESHLRFFVGREANGTTNEVDPIRIRSVATLRPFPVRAKYAEALSRRVAATVPTAIGNAGSRLYSRIVVPGDDADPELFHIWLPSR
jgi:hypothetical protein